MQDWRRFKNPFDTVTGTNTHTHIQYMEESFAWNIYGQHWKAAGYIMKSGIIFRTQTITQLKIKPKENQQLHTMHYWVLRCWTLWMQVSRKRKSGWEREREKKWTKGSNKDVHQSTRKMIEGENVQMCCLFQFQAPGRLFFPCAIVVKPDAKRIGLNGTHRGKNEKCLNHRTCLITSDSIPLQLPSS